MAKGHSDDADDAGCQKHERGWFRHLITHGITQNSKGWALRKWGEMKTAAPVIACCRWGCRIGEAEVPESTRITGNRANYKPVLGAGNQGRHIRRHGLENGIARSFEGRQAPALNRSVWQAAARGIQAKHRNWFQRRG